uniref:Uncharacterized protein n=1 Tax=Pelusios castaneus TaxID=367368 RepID=A0A8C8RS06_9SAUR
PTTTKKNQPNKNPTAIKINTRIANEKYLRSHKEVELLLSGFLRCSSLVQVKQISSLSPLLSGSQLLLPSLLPPPPGLPFGSQRFSQWVVFPLSLQ